MRNKRGTDHEWTIVKYKGDIALYAKCLCGSRYAASRNVGRNKDGSWNMTQKIFQLYQYCPNCGARKKRYSDIVIHINKFPWE